MSDNQAPGVVVTINAPDGHVVGVGACFEQSTPAGFSLVEAQTITAKRLASIEAIRALCHPDIASVTTSYEANKVVESLINSKSYIRNVLPIGHDNA